MNTFWCFTQCNPEYALDSLFEEYLDLGKIRYASWQLEMSSTGTPHYQGYVELPRNQRLSYVRKLLDKTDWSVVYSTREYARNYTRKEESRIEGPYEVGTWIEGGPGRRSDLREYAQAILNGTERKKLIEEFPRQYISYPRGTDAAYELVEKKRTWITELHVLIGPPGCGKTTMVSKISPDMYWKQSSKWWDRYAGEADVCLDDFYGWIPFHDLLRLADGTPYMVERKGGQCQFLAHRLYITSNKAPIEWYRADGNFCWQALFRRITTITVWLDGQKHIYSSYDDFVADVSVHRYAI